MSQWTHTSIQIPENFGSAVGGSSDVDMVRANLFIALMGLNGEHQSEAANSLQIWRKPDMVRTGATAIPKGGLVLVPMTTLNNITGGKKPGGAHVLLGNHEVEGVIVGFYGSAPAKPIADKGKNKQATFFFQANSEKKQEIPTIYPFWWVTGVPDASKANMAMFKVKMGDVNVLCMKNNHAIPAFTQLIRHVPAQAVEQKKSTLQVDSSADPAPAKRAKKS